jgi:hypothetical protein
MFTKSDGGNQAGAGTTTPPTQPYAPTDAEMRRQNERRTQRALKASLKMVEGAASAKPKWY